MFSRKRFRGGAVAGVTALFALVCAWRSPAPSPRTAEAEDAAEELDQRHVAQATPIPAAHAWSPSDAPDTHPNIDADDATSKPIESVPSRRARRIARAHLRTIASRYGLEASDVDTLEHRDTYVGDGAGARLVRFRQVMGGRPVVGREVSVILNADDEPVGVTGRLAPSVALRRAELAASRAVRSAHDAVSSLAGDSVRARSGSAAADFEDFVSSRAGGTLERARVRRVLFDRDGELVPAHQVELAVRAAASGESRASSVIVSAIDGATLHERSLVHADSFRVFADPWSGPYDSPTGTDPTPHPTGLPGAYTPSYVPAQLVTLSNQPFSRNDPWLPPAATSLSGNSVFAYVDRAAPSGFDPAFDLEVPPTAPGVFDYTYDPSLSPTASDAQRRAAATHLFFVTSYLHDVFYDAGFDESAGNAQASNFGRGGLGGDRLIVAAQAHALDDRSLAVIPPDGSTPRLSFGIYKGQGGRPDRDGAVDSTLVAHEWGHLLAERLVGNAVGLGNAQGRAISEGTADFVALLLTVRPEDINVPANQNFRGVYAVGGYVASATADDAYYFGLRRVPYSTDKSRNALSFQHIARAASLPAGAPMRASDPAENALPHNAGEVWGTALWECYVSLLQAHPFMEAQDRMRRYLVASLRAMPFEPTFTEAAEALRVVTSAYDPADEHRFVAAFARRGLGVGATSASRTSTDLVGVAESELTGSGLRVVAISLDDSDETCDGDGVLDLGEFGRLRVTVENVGRSSMSGGSAQVTAQAGSAPLLFPNGNTLMFPSMNAGARATASVRVALDGDGAGAPADVRISFSAPVLPSSTVSFRAPVHHDESIASATDTMSTRTSTLAFERNGVRTAFVPTRDTSDDFAHLEDGPARGTYALVTGPLTVTSQLGVSFRMRHSLAQDESSSPIDGAVVEISEDGVHFEDVTKAGANAGYGGALPAGTTNPIGARPAYTGMSAGFPAFVTRSLDLGNSYVGKTVVLRFRVGAAGANKSAYGFDVDDLTVTGISGAPFATRVAETSDGTACNRPPVADAGDDISVTQLAGDPALGVPTVVSISAVNSFDPDGTALSFAWTQLSGPAVVLASSTLATTTFPVPSIKGDTVFVFQVAVSDVVDTTTDTVRVTVRRDNRAPTAVASGPASVASGAANVVLDGALSSDPDGDALTYTWKQTTGPAVSLVPSDATASFAAPAVTADTKLAFSLEVSDGIVTSAPASVEVLVRAATKADAGAPATPAPDDGGAPVPGNDAGSNGSSGSAPNDGDEVAADDGDDSDGGCAAAGARGASASAPAWVIALVAGLAMRRRRRRDSAR